MYILYGLPRNNLIFLKNIFPIIHINSRLKIQDTKLLNSLIYPTTLTLYLEVKVSKNINTQLSLNKTKYKSVKFNIRVMTNFIKSEQI